ncbi:MAG: TetR/AcrR family transcriptional regulator; helix-turn-helix transcriptional regulator [Sulfurospirillum cavolei]|nr:TetR/AcrR family transcriptional regulator; helix-turn-helix transcriptional regulator [Sulfurospirillum cavolei]
MLFASRGFYSTTIPDIAKAIDMSVGNIYNYFSSKEILAKEIIKYSSDILGAEIRRVNEETCSVQEKIRKIVSLYFEMASSKPQHINYFLRVYIANREVFKDGCEGMLCVSAFVTELMIFFRGRRCVRRTSQSRLFFGFRSFYGLLGRFRFFKRRGRFR